MILRQRGDGDCGIAALALFLELPYEDAHRAMRAVLDAEVAPGCPIYGLTNRHVVQAASRLRVRLTPTRSFDLDTDEGVLRVRFKGGGRWGHFVAVKHGLVLCPSDGLAVPWEDYLRRDQGRPCTLLKGSL